MITKRTKASPLLEAGAVLNNYFKARLSIPCLCAQKTAAMIITKDGVISLSTKGAGRATMKSL